MAKFKFYHQRLRILRHFYGYSLQDLANKTGVSKQALSQYENGEALPRYPNLLAICKILKVDTEMFTSKNVVFEINNELKVHIISADGNNSKQSSNNCPICGVRKCAPKCNKPENETCFRPHGGSCKVLNCEHFF